VTTYYCRHRANKQLSYAAANNREKFFDGGNNRFTLRYFIIGDCSRSDLQALSQLLKTAANP